MSTPKAVTKIKQDKNGTHVEYVSNCDAVQYYFFELSRAALRDVGKFVAKKFKEEYYRYFNRHTGKTGGTTKYRVFSSKNTKFPRVEVGLKGGAGSGVRWWSYLQEFGARDGSVPKLGLLQKSVNDNVAEIIKIESQYLSGLEGEAERLEKMIEEDEMEGGEENEV